MPQSWHFPPFSGDSDETDFKSSVDVQILTIDINATDEEDSIWSPDTGEELQPLVLGIVEQSNVHIITTTPDTIDISSDAVNEALIQNDTISEKIAQSSVFGNTHNNNVSSVANDAKSKQNSTFIDLHSVNSNSQNITRHDAVAQDIIDISDIEVIDIVDKNDTDSGERIKLVVDNIREGEEHNFTSNTETLNDTKRTKQISSSPESKQINNNGEIQSKEKKNKIGTSKKDETSKHQRHRKGFFCT